MVAILHRVGRRNDAALVDHIVAALGACALGQPDPVEDALGAAVAALVSVA